jgi:hypothetical protein
MQRVKQGLIYISAIGYPKVELNISIWLVSRYLLENVYKKVFSGDVQCDGKKIIYFTAIPGLLTLCQSSKLCLRSSITSYCFSFHNYVIQPR